MTKSGKNVLGQHESMEDCFTRLNERIDDLEKRDREREHGDYI